jgi:hypothetical protein
LKWSSGKDLTGSVPQIEYDKRHRIGAIANALRLAEPGNSDKIRGMKFLAKAFAGIFIGTSSLHSAIGQTNTSSAVEVNSKILET